MIRMVLPLLTGGVVIYLLLKKRIKASLAGICLVATVIAAGMIFMESSSGGRREITGIEESETEMGEDTNLEVQTSDGKEHRVTIRTAGKTYTKAEARRLLKEKEKDLEKEILGKNKSADRIEWNLELPVSFDDSPVYCKWESDPPDIISDDGELGTDIPEKGVDVTLMCTLSLGKEQLNHEWPLHVYPSLEEDALEETLQKESDRLNEETEGSGEYRLPDQLNGKKLIWYQETEQKGGFLCLFIAFVAVFSVIAKNKKKQEKKEKRQEQLNREYPDLVSKIQLLTAAGMSLRRCMERLAGEYSEVRICWREMESGVTEQEAYAHFGERCGTPEYRKLALLLAQSQKKGGQKLSVLLEREVQEAFEARKRNARAEGEKASIRMILPMGIMLMIVMIVIMVPAMLSIQ